MKIPTEDFTGVALAFGDVILNEMMLEVMMWVLDMEVDKVAKFVTHASGATCFINSALFLYCV